MKHPFKKILLTGTALVVVYAFAHPAQAAPPVYTTSQTVTGATGATAATGGDAIDFGAPNITLTGGASGGFTNEGNSANISVDSGSQNITAGAMLLTAGGGWDWVRPG